MIYDSPLYPYVAVDVFALAHFIYHSSIKRKVQEGGTSQLEEVSFPNAHAKKSSAIYARMALEMIRAIENFSLYPRRRGLLLLFDNATSKTEARRFISESYKKSRKALPSSFYRTVDFVQFYFTQCGSPETITLRIPQREADDLIKVLVQNIDTPESIVKLKEGEKILCIANDSDWRACLGGPVDMWWFMNRDEVYTQDSFLNEFGFSPSMKNVAVYKALMGDTADDIPAILKKRDLSHEDLIYLVTTYGTDERATSLVVGCSMDPKVTPKIRAILKDEFDTYSVNLKLTDSLSIPYSRIVRHATKGKDNALMKTTLDKVLHSVINSLAPTRDFSFGGVSADV